MSEETSLYTIKVVNTTSGRVDVHKGLTMDEVDYIKLTPTLQVDIVEVNSHRKGKKAVK